MVTTTPPTIAAVLRSRAPEPGRMPLWSIELLESCTEIQVVT